jgi:outer membrane protein
VTAGRLPELNAAQLEAQLASDSANLINAISNYNSAILDIKALMNLDFTTPYEIQAPEVNMADQMTVSNMDPEMIYAEASKHFGAIKSAELRTLASQKRLAAARGALWPQLGLNAQFGTNYATSYREVTDYSITGYQQTPSVALGNSDTLLVYQPTFQYNTRRIPLGTQLDNNFRQTIALALNIPIFNSWQAQYNLRQARLNILSNELNKDQARLKLKQDVYKAYNEAINAIQKYNAADRAQRAANRAYEFADKRYQLGLTNTVEYLTIQNNQFISESNLLSAKYDLIFKLKVIDYYLGKELKL